MADDPPAGVPEWIVTYGDMMSLLLTFFIMLVSLSEVKGDAKYQAMMQSIMQYMGYTSGPAAPAGEGYPLSGMVERLSKLGSHTSQDRGRGGVKAPGPEGKDMRIFHGREGTSITAGDLLGFDAGSDELSPQAQDVLKTLAEHLAGKPNKIDVRGHTSPDPPPPGSVATDNFELAYRRARTVADRLVQLGIQPERMRLSAVADNEPPPASADRRATQLNRVEIFVLDAYAKDFIGPRDLQE